MLWYGLPSIDQLQRPSLTRYQMHGQAAQEMQACFAAFDLNGDGYITLDELESGLKRMGSNVDPNSLHLLLEIADKNGDGRLDYQVSFCWLLLAFNFGIGAHTRSTLSGICECDFHWAKCRTRNA